MSDRIRWTAVHGTVVSWFGYVGSVTEPLFHILHPVTREASPGDTRYDEWALCATFPGETGEVRYGGADPGAPDRLKAEAERWLAGFGAAFAAEPEVMSADADEAEAFAEAFRAQFAPGRRVRFAHPDAGYPADQEMAATLLAPGEVYVIEWSDIGFSSSCLGLAGVESGLGLNSVLFEPVPDEPARRADMSPRAGKSLSTRQDEEE